MCICRQAYFLSVRVPVSYLWTLNWGLLMHRLSAALIAAVSTIALTQIASAADPPVKAPVYKAPVATPAYSWTSFYVGAHAGYGFGFAKTPEPIETDFLGGRGFIGGLLAGYNY